jgi:hypothetical protein
MPATVVRKAPAPFRNIEADSDLLWGCAEIAAYLGKLKDDGTPNVRWVYTALREGRIPFERLGHRMIVARKSSIKAKLPCDRTRDVAE